MRRPQDGVLVWRFNKCWENGLTGLKGNSRRLWRNIKRREAGGEQDALFL